MGLKSNFGTSELRKSFSLTPMNHSSLVQLTTVERFSKRVEYYQKYRPSYPNTLIEFLLKSQLLKTNSKIADIGSGTGLLSELFLKRGYEVQGIEPNSKMRKAAESFLCKFPNFQSINGRAEKTTLNTGSADLIVAAQSFHWFNLKLARLEFNRILKKECSVVILWNELEKDRTTFLKKYEDLLLKYGIDYSRVRHQNISETQIKHFFKPTSVQKRVLVNSQVFDLKGLIGRTLSSSFTPLFGHPSHQPMIDELTQLFTEQQEGGQVTFFYQTLVYTGRFS